MKKRNLLTNIFSAVLIVSLVAFLLVIFEIIKGGLGTAIKYISLPLAIISVACIDIVFPIIDNRGLLKASSKVRILAIIKIILFIASFLVMGLSLRGIIDNQIVAVVIFVVLYFAQFFINIDPKQAKLPVDDDQYDDDEDDE